MIESGLRRQTVSRFTEVVSFEQNPGPNSPYTSVVDDNVTYKNDTRTGHRKPFDTLTEAHREPNGSVTNLLDNEDGYRLHEPVHQEHPETPEITQAFNEI